MRVGDPGILDSDIFHVSPESCVSFLDPAIESWDFDLKTFGMEVTLNRRLTPGAVRRFEFMEKPEEGVFTIEPGFEQFLNDSTPGSNTAPLDGVPETLGFQEFHLVLGGIAAESGVIQELFKARLDGKNALFRLFHEFESAHRARRQPAVQRHFHAKCLQIEVPRFNCRIRNDTQLSGETWKMSLSRNSRIATRICS